MNLAPILKPDQQFELDARHVMERRYGVLLPKGPVAVVPGLVVNFDYVADGERVVGDAKFYKMRRGPDQEPKQPNAKLATISECVLLLHQMAHAEHRFLVFGNEREVPLLWLKRFAPIATDVEFFFLEHGALTDLQRPATGEKA